MTHNVNIIILEGNLTRDPEVRYVGNAQTPVCDFSVATNRRFKKKDGERVEQCTFHECSAWGQSAQFLGEYAGKGTKVFLRGRGENESWEDKDGNKRTKYRIVAEEVQIEGGNRNEPAHRTTKAQAPKNDQQMEGYGDDEPPF